jgi:hypothetical protein
VGDVIMVCPIHKAAPRPMHGPRRIQWVIAHRACLTEAAGILETDLPPVMRAKAAAYLRAVDAAILDAGWTPLHGEDYDEWVDYWAEKAGVLLP